MIKNELVAFQLVSEREQSDITDLQALDDAIQRIDSKLEACQANADKVDYALSVASGVLCGLVDSLFVGELSITSKDIGLSHEKVNRFIESEAKKRGYVDNGKGLKGAVEFFEKKYPVAQDNVWSGKGIGITAKNHHLADFAHHPTPAGLLSAILVQFFRTGLFVDKDGEIHLLPVDTNKKDILENWLPLIASGILMWLANLAEHSYHEETGNELPGYLQKLVKLLASAPAAIQVIKCADNWIGHLISDMAGSKQTAGKGMGIPGVFLSFAYELSSLPLINQTGLTKRLDELYTKEKFNLRKEIPIYEHLTKQAIPVALNELLVRSFYFVRHLAEEMNAHGNLQDIAWERVIPVGNRTIERMLLISSLTFSAADTLDAAVRAAIESAGNWAIWGGKFAAKVNYVGATRATIAVFKEISAEQKELQLLKEKRILSEAKSIKAVGIVEEYRTSLEDIVNRYLSEDYESILKGFSDIDTGLSFQNSDRVIRGNVTIQRMLGKEVQFTSQTEFDDLMESDEDFKL